MIFDGLNSPADPPDAEHRRRRVSSRGEGRSGSRRRRRSSFESASRLSADSAARGDGSARAWLWVLALLVVAALGSAFFLQQQKGGPIGLPGEAPGRRLAIFVDPILAPLETGTSGYDPVALASLAQALQDERAAVGLDDKEIFSTAGTVAGILQEAADDRGRHLKQLVDLGSPVIGLSEGGAGADPAMTETARRHHELAVDVSWQRNSGVYRNRIDELMARLSRLENGRFTGAPRANLKSAANPQ